MHLFFVYHSLRHPAARAPAGLLDTVVHEFLSGCVIRSKTGDPRLLRISITVCHNVGGQVLLCAGLRGGRAGGAPPDGAHGHHRRPAQAHRRVVRGRHAPHRHDVRRAPARQVRAPPIGKDCRWWQTLSTDTASLSFGSQREQPASAWKCLIVSSRVSSLTGCCVEASVGLHTPRRLTASDWPGLDFVCMSRL